MSSKGAGAVTGEQDETGGLVPKLRFPEFRDAEDWECKPLNWLLSEPKKRNRDLKYGPQDVLSVSGEYGCVNQIEFMGRSYAGVSVKDYHVVETGDVVYTKSPLKVAPFGIIKANKGRSGIVSTLYAVYRPTANARAEYIDHYFSRNYNLNSYLQPIVKKGAKNDMKVKNSDVLTGSVWVPKIDEQKKIADCLSSIDTLIAAEADKLEALKGHKKGLMQQLFPAPGETTPRVRFPEFRGAGDWRWSQLGDILVTITPPKKLPTSDYQQQGEFPIIDQGQNLIAGWTDDSESVLRNPLPVVAFGDHTCALKFVDFPFSQGADGLKIIRPNRIMTVEYLYNSLQAYPVNSGEYKRHFLDLKEKLIAFPDVETGEQQMIANCLTSIDGRIAAQGDKIDALKAHKMGLMQQLFPVADQVQA